MRLVVTRQRSSPLKVPESWLESEVSLPLPLPLAGGTGSL